MHISLSLCRKFQKRKAAPAIDLTSSEVSAPKIKIPMRAQKKAAPADSMQLSVVEKEMLSPALTSVVIDLEKEVDVELCIAKDAFDLVCGLVAMYGDGPTMWDMKYWKQHITH